jgi:hypothetical protein
MALTYGYNLILAVNENDLKQLELAYGQIDLMNVEFQTVQGATVMKFSQAPENVEFNILKDRVNPKHSVTAAFFAVKGEFASKKESSLQFVTIPLKTDLTDKQILQSLESGSLSKLVKHSQHYGLFAVAQEQ